MSDALTREEVERIAALASLELTPEEIDTFAPQLAEILEYAKLVQQIDTTGVPPTSHGLAAAPYDRDDEPRPSLDRDEALAAAPDAAPYAGLFRVPRVIG
ncbi:MAG TPA: Asp-tRNA(Asn)/Glu-tRNA(Gln) amidotransferase subunit GatC [Vicinamibacterales bacterium]|nr:Asp-tRNA(Asn)/Glu-tRNA(Gln) amidotransferase subunit GatC [Vicinamibacterales bacterium]